MLSTKRIKELLKKPDMPDEEAEELRDRALGLAEIAFAKWSAEKINKEKNEEA